MLHQFDHRYSTYQGATQRQLNVGILPRPSPEQKRDPDYAVQPRYWVHEDLVKAAIPRYPAPLAAAVTTGDTGTMQYVLLLWAAGFFIERNCRDRARALLQHATTINLDEGAPLAATSKEAIRLHQDFPLTEADVEAIITGLDEPEALAASLVERFSPKWLFGWRDICRANDERTLIASTLPRAAVGHTFPLTFCPGIVCPGIEGQLVCGLLAALNAFVTDYATRQKMGGTHITYTLLNQIPCVAPDALAGSAQFLAAKPFIAWAARRVTELVYSARELTSFAKDCGYEGPPFQWNEARRFEIRCELDAAFFHLYLPAEPDGNWRRANEETSAELAELQRHFPSPRDAVAHILDQFPVVRQKDEQLFEGHYRTKERILEIYDAMLTAICSGTAYRTALDSQPGTPLPALTEAAAQ